MREQNYTATLMMYFFAGGLMEVLKDVGLNYWLVPFAAILCMGTMIRYNLPPGTQDDYWLG